jgi:hypothetical protein
MCVWPVPLLLCVRRVFCFTSGLSFHRCSSWGGARSLLGKVAFCMVPSHEFLFFQIDPLSCPESIFGQHFSDIMPSRCCAVVVGGSKGRSKCMGSSQQGKIVNSSTTFVKQKLQKRPSGSFLPTQPKPHVPCSPQMINQRKDQVK